MDSDSQIEIPEELSSSSKDQYLFQTTPLTTKDIIKASSTFGKESVHEVISISYGQEYVLTGNLAINSIFEATKVILCIKYTEDLENLAAGFIDGTVRVFRLSSGECIKTLTDREYKSIRIPVTSITYRPSTNGEASNNTLTCSYVNGDIKCWDCKTSCCLYTINEMRQTLSLKYHPYEPNLITVGDDGIINMYNEETQQKERSFHRSGAHSVLDGHTSRIFAVCFNPTAHNEFVTGGWDNTVYIWDCRQENSIRHMTGMHICGEGLDVKNKQILSCSYQKKEAIQLWDYGSGSRILVVEPDSHKSLLYCGNWISKTMFACGGTNPNLLRIVDRQTLTNVGIIRNLKYGVFSMDSCPARKRSRTRSLPQKANSDSNSLEGAKSEAAKSNTEPQVQRSTILTKWSGRPTWESDEYPKVAFCSGKKIYEMSLIL